MKKALILGALIVFAMIVPSAAYAHNDSVDRNVGTSTQNEEQSCFGIKTEAGNEIMNQYVRDHVDEILMTLVDDPAYFHAEDRDLNSLFIMNPFRTFSETNNERVISNTYNYAVLSNNKVVCVIHVVDTEFGLTYNVTNFMVEQLNQCCQDNKDRLIVLRFETDDSAPEILVEEYPNRGIHNNVDNIFADLSGRYEDQNADYYRQSALFEFMEDTNHHGLRSSFVTTYTPTQGFSINENGYKRLDMSNCLVSQGTGNQWPAPCSRACIATVYRYRTATHVLEMNTLDQVNTALGSNGFNMGSTDGQVGMLNYLMPLSAANLYEKHNYNLLGLITHYEVMHNINNRFPIIYGGENTVSGGQHAFVLQGYRLIGNYMSYFYFNPWGYDGQTAFLPEGSPHTMTNTQHNTYWLESGNSCLLEP